VSATVNLAAAVDRIRPEIRRSPLEGHEHVHGWGVLACPFDSGDVLALRVIPQNDFAPYTSIWHRSPDGSWSIYVDGPRLDVACPRYWGAETEHAQLADVDVEWTGPSTLRVEMADPPLEWTTSMDASLLARAANATCRRLPDAVLRSRPMIRLVEWTADALFDLGDVTLAMTVPNGQDARVLTKQLFPIVDGSATFDGVDLGSPARAPDTPVFGDARLPARPVFTIGGAYMTILDPVEYERTIQEVRESTSSAQRGSPDRQDVGEVD
jgi:hypothetical protein